MTYIRGTRERYELGDMVLIRQHDLKQTVQISVAARTYLITPETAAAPADPAAPAAEMPKPPGVVNVETSIADVGERKQMFGQEARHVMTVVDRQPQPGACDQSKQRMETDAWYIDAPKVVAAQPPNTLPAPSAAACRDDVKATLVGDGALLGFPMAYTTTTQGADGKPVVVMQMEVTEFEVTNLDAALFEIPEGMTVASNTRDLAKAVSDANEAQLASRAARVERRAEKAWCDARGCSRACEQDRTERGHAGAAHAAHRRVGGTEDGGRPARRRASGRAARVRERSWLRLSARLPDYGAQGSKPGRIGRMIKATAGESTTKDVTEAKLTLQLVPVGGAKPRFSTNTSGNDGGIGFKTGLRLARAAAMMYLRYASPLGALNAMQMMNMGGMGGYLSNPMMMQMQAGSGVMGTGRGVDRTAGAAMFLMDQAMTGASGVNADGAPSYDASLAEALQDGAKKVGENLKR